MQHQRPATRFQVQPVHHPPAPGLRAVPDPMPNVLEPMFMPAIPAIGWVDSAAGAGRHIHSEHGRGGLRRGGLPAWGLRKSGVGTAGHVHARHRIHWLGGGRGSRRRATCDGLCGGLGLGRRLRFRRRAGLVGIFIPGMPGIDCASAGTGRTATLRINARRITSPPSKSPLRPSSDSRSTIRTPMAPCSIRPRTRI